MEERLSEEFVLDGIGRVDGCGCIVGHRSGEDGVGRSAETNFHKGALAVAVLFGLDFGMIDARVVVGLEQRSAVDGMIGILLGRLRQQHRVSAAVELTGIDHLHVALEEVLFVCVEHPTRVADEGVDARRQRRVEGNVAAHGVDVTFGLHVELCAIDEAVGLAQKFDVEETAEKGGLHGEAIDDEGTQPDGVAAHIKIAVGHNVHLFLRHYSVLQRKTLLHFVLSRKRGTQ